MKQIYKGSNFLPVVLSFLIVFQVVWIAACIEVQSGSIGQVVVDGYLQKEIEAENAHLIPVGLNPVAADIQRARTYWLRQGDVVQPVWDTFEFHWQNEGTMCPFTTNVSETDCAICNVCSLPPNSPGPPCFNAAPSFEGDVVKIVVDPAFMPGSETEVHDFQGNVAAIQGTCSNIGTSRPLITPAVSGVYRFASGSPHVKFPGAMPEMPVEETKIHLVGGDNGPQTKVAYQLRRADIDAKSYWTWAVEGNDFWMENFSSNLRITNVKVFLGKCSDGSAQGKSCQVPNEAVAVKPSRVLFLPDFDGSVSTSDFEDQFRCYSNAAAVDGSYINLTTCRQRADTPPNQTLSLKAVPTYQYELIDPMTNQFQKLPWFVEFNTADVGAEADADPSTPAFDGMPTTAELIIEFTIEAN